MTEREAAIVAAYTGYLIGSFDAMQRYADEVMEFPTMTHMFGNKDFAEELQKRSKADFVAITVEG